MGGSTNCRLTCRSEWNGRARPRHNTGMVLTLALNYSARSELVDAFRSMVDAAAQNGGIEHLRIDEEMVGAPSLYAASARSGSGRAHFGRDAPEQLPAVAAGLCGNLCDSNLWPISAACICSKPSPNTRSASGATAGSTITSARQRQRP